MKRIINLIYFLQILYDFEIRYPQSHSNLLDKWHLISEKIPIIFAKLKGYNTVIDTPEIYSSASKTLIKKLDSIHNTGIRICTGAFRTSPVTSLMVDANEYPLNYRRERQETIVASKVYIPSNSILSLIKC